MTEPLEYTRWKRWPAILTLGAFTARGQIAGVFYDESDARSPDADKLAIAIVSVDSLTPEQLAAAARNSERI